jgi:hypothetical protein
MDDMETKAKAAFEKDALLCHLVGLENTLEQLESRKDEIFKRVNSFNGNHGYNFGNI